jgi:prepilin-type N-terminal cleavage/methylation domain-containing protein
LRRETDKPAVRTAGRPAGCFALRHGFTLIELLVVVSIIAILAAIALPNYVRIKDKAKEAEAKSALHAIQLDLERWGVDNEGEYPAYIIGGDNAAAVRHVGEDNEIYYEHFEIEPARTSDPMIRHGYRDEYPGNPFIRNQLAVSRLQADIGDPLRSRMPDGQELGTRFGPFGFHMGQTLCEPRYVEWSYYDHDKRKQVYRPTWANIQYNFYDVWRANLRNGSFLPGSFMYKSIGELLPSMDDDMQVDTVEVGDSKAAVPHDIRDKATYPIARTNYMLGVWGAMRGKGLDVLGEEPLVLFQFGGTRRAANGSGEPEFIYDPSTGHYNLPGPKTVDYYKLVGIPTWTRGVNRTHVGPLWGSPYGPSQREFEQVSIGNSNGMRDALVLILTSGQR